MRLRHKAKKPNRRNSKEETLNHGANHTRDDKVVNGKEFY